MKRLATFGAGLLLAGSVAAAEGLDPAVQVAGMHRGVNVVAWAPPWIDPARPQFAVRHFGLIKRAGFDSVQLLLTPFSQMDREDRLDPAWLEKLDGLVKAALGEGLTVVLLEHDDARCGVDAAACRGKIDAFWRQIGVHYKNAPPQVLFEILNEPNNAFTPARWNAELRKTLAVIRETNPARNVVVGPGGMDGVEEASVLDLPAEDRHLIAVVHYFAPLPFTHQGASWVKATEHLSGVRWGSKADHATLAKDFGDFTVWGKEHHRPVMLGSFGAYDKAPPLDRLNWISSVARQAEASGLPWVYWQFDYDFNVYDVAKESWNLPVRGALIP